MYSRLCSTIGQLHTEGYWHDCSFYFSWLQFKYDQETKDENLDRSFKPEGCEKTQQNLLKSHHRGKSKLAMKVSKD